MGSRTDDSVRLNEAQRRLVRENIGLVGVHIRRFVPGLAAPRRDREWDDLFQEGCLGLINAAASFDQQCGIAFAAYALARIHAAVSVALNTRFTTVKLPRRRSRRSNSPDDLPMADRAEECRPDVHQLSDESARPARKARPYQSDTHDPSETVGDRMRDKYERALRAAGAHLVCKGSARGDRDKLVHILIEDRLLVPQPESRTALRQIARDTRSSFGRVAKCEKQLTVAVRNMLEDDPEFRELNRQAKSTPHGPDLQLDAKLERTLADSSARAFVARLTSATNGDRAKLLYALLVRSGVDIAALAQSHAHTLGPESRERLLRETCDTGIPARTSKHTRERLAGRR